MSKRNRDKRRQEVVIRPPVPKSVRLINGLRAFMRENVRVMVIVMGVGFFMQAFIPWTSSAREGVYFVVAGSILLGLGLPKRWWT